MVNYITYSDLAKDIRENIYKIPHDIDGVIAIPRSGLIPGIMIAELFNIPITTVDNLIKYENIEDSFLGNGRRLNCKNFINGPKFKRKFLVIDDTYCSGAGMNNAQEKLKNFNYEFIYCVAYSENITVPENVICLKNISFYYNLSPFKHAKCNLFEWNIFNHGMLHEFLFDIDGVIFMDPPDERNTEAYVRYIENPIPKIIPQDLSNNPINFATYRLNKYRKITTDSLINLGINVGTLYMFNSETYEERGKLLSPFEYKANIYSSNDDYKLFVESDDWQAKLIHEISGKPVLSVEKNMIYN